MNVLLLSSITLGIGSLIDIINNYRVKEKRHFGVAFLSFSILFLLYVLCDPLDVFFDRENYLPFFQVLDKIDLKYLFVNSKYEIGWSVFNKFLNTIFGDEVMVLIVAVAVIIALSFGFAVKKYSSFPALSVFLFLTFGFWGMFGAVLRQAVAMSISIFSYKYILENKPIKFLFIIFLAASFHYSSLVMLLLYPLSKLKLSLRFIVLMFCGGGIIFLFSSKIIGLVNKLFDTSYEVSRNNNWLMFLFVLIIALIEVYFCIKYFDNEKSMRVFCQMALCAAMFLLISLYNYSFVRIAYYFLISQIFVIPNIIEKISDKRDALIVTFLVVGIAIAYYSLVLKFNDGAMKEYRFFW